MARPYSIPFHVSMVGSFFPACPILRHGFILLLFWGFGSHGLSAQTFEPKARNFNNPASNEVVEGCVAGAITFFSPDTSQAWTVRLTPRGSAINGLDYLELQDLSITLAVGQDSLDLLIAPIADAEQEGAEVLNLVYATPLGTDSITMVILDPPVLEPLPDQEICSGTNLLFPNPLPENFESYFWFPGSGLNDNTLGRPTLNISTDSLLFRTYTLTATDANGCTATDTLIVRIDPVPFSTFSGPDSLCPQSSGLFAYTGVAPSTARYDWDFGQGATIISGQGPGPYEVAWEQPGTPIVCLTVTVDSCTYQTVCQEVQINPVPFVRIDEVADQCLEGNAIDFSATGTDGIHTYAWDFGPNALIRTSDSPTPQGITFTRPGIQEITLDITRKGCPATAATTFELVETPSADFGFSSEVLCQDACVQGLYQGEILGAEQTFSWNFGPAALPSTSGLATTPCIRFDTTGILPVSLEVSYKGCSQQLTRDIEILDLPVIGVDAGEDTSFCEGTAGIQLSAGLANGNNQGVSFRWFALTADTASWGIDDPISPRPSVNPTFPGGSGAITYFLTAQNENGCFSPPDSVTVTVKPAPKLETGGDQLICENSPGEIITGRPAAENQAAEPFSYQWFPAAGLSNPLVASPLARPDTSTQYSLVARSINGCTSLPDSQATVRVAVQPLPNAGIAQADTAICEGDTLTLNGFTDAEGENITYRWSPVQTGFVNDPESPQPRVSPGFSTVYSLIVAQNGCRSEAANVSVRVRPRPTVSVPGNQALCLGDSLTLRGLAAGDPEGDLYAYEWLPRQYVISANGRNLRARPDSSIIYTFFATSSEGCRSLPAPVNILVKPSPQPLMQAAREQICEGDTLKLFSGVDFGTGPSGTGILYDWRGPEDLLIRTQADSLAWPVQASGFYRVTTSIGGDCPASDSVFIRVDPAIQAGIAADSTRLCEGSEVVLSATGSLDATATYQWLTTEGPAPAGGQSIVASPGSSTEYRVVITQGACFDTASINLEVVPAPQIAYAATLPQGCVPHEVSFAAAPEGSYFLIWDFGDGSSARNQLSPTHAFTQPGTFTVQLAAVGPLGCMTVLDDLEIAVSDTAVAQFGSTPSLPDSLYLPAAILTLNDQSTGASTWLWDFGDGNSSTESNPVHQYQETGSYQVTLTVTNQDGCISTFATGPYHVTLPELKIPNVFTPNGDGINDRFEPVYRGGERVTMKIFDRWGRVYFEATTAPFPGWDGTLEGRDAQEGVYFYDIQVGEKHFQGAITLLR